MRGLEWKDIPDSRIGLSLFTVCTVRLHLISNVDGEVLDFHANRSRISFAVLHAVLDGKHSNRVTVCGGTITRHIRFELALHRTLLISGHFANAQRSPSSRPAHVRAHILAAA